MLKVRDVLRKASATLSKDDNITVAQTILRRTGERIVPVVDDKGRVIGFLTRRESIIVTSTKSPLRAVDVARDSPLLTLETDVSEAYQIMMEQRVWEAPVVSDPTNERLEGVTSFRDMIERFIDEGFEPKAGSVAEVMTTDNLEQMIMEPHEKITKVWSRLVLKGLPGVIIVRSRDEPIPVGFITARNLVETGRWRFHREGEARIVAPAKARNVMTRGVVVATPETPIQYVARFMVENDVDVIPVIDKNGFVIGVVSQADIVRAYIEGAKPGRKPVKPVVVVKPVSVEERVVYLSEKQVLEQIFERPRIERVEETGLTAKDALVEELPVITINDTVEHARRLMLRAKSNYVLVIGEDGSIIGVVSKWNMLKSIGLKGPYWKRRTHDMFFIDYVTTRNPPRVKIDEPIENVALKMFDSGSDVAIVEARDGETVGFVTKDSLVKAFIEKEGTSLLVENIMTPRGIGVVHPHHSLAHTVSKMKTYMLDAITVVEGGRVMGVVSANRLPFVAYESSRTGRKSRRLVWVRKLVRGAARLGRYVKVTPLLAIDATVKVRDAVKPADTIYKAFELMEKNNVDGVPVIDEKQVVGVVSKYDILREIVRRAKAKAEKRVRPEISREIKEKV